MAVAVSGESSGASVVALEAIVELLKTAGKRTIIVENNYSGQFARYLRSETSFVPDGYIRKYDGEPFMPHHIVDAVKEQMAGKTKLSVPTHEIMRRNDIQPPLGFLNQVGSPRFDEGPGPSPSPLKTSISKRTG